MAIHEVFAYLLVRVRSGFGVFNSYGHRWLVGHSIEEVAPEDMQRRYDALMQAEGGAQ